MVEQLSVRLILFILGTGLLTAIAAVSDFRTRRIPNTLTVPAFALGWIYQGVFHGFDGLLDAAAAFALAFGTLYVLWLIGGGGGGDVKLMGALSVWLGFHLTLLVMIASAVFVLLGTIGVMLGSIVQRGFRRTNERFLATGRLTKKERKRGKAVVETTEQKQQRRLMAYAVPVAFATWLVVLWKFPTI
jgi:prepilin peptidase CpaA